MEENAAEIQRIYLPPDMPYDDIDGGLNAAERILDEIYAVVHRYEIDASALNDGYEFRRLVDTHKEISKVAASIGVLRVMVDRIKKHGVGT